MHKHSWLEPPVQPVPGPVPETAGPEPIDRVHLFRMTLGDRHLQDEVLDLFDQQIALLVARMDMAPPAAAATLAHTLKGSARGIGAWGVVEAAEAIEMAVAIGTNLAGPIAAMAAAGAEASRAIALMRQSPDAAE
ncbi:MAG: Hpt domain-containing protein [Rhodoplanes sp.]|uniref:Hpt domain-containing protein n=1 Tax=Rhodoplanes sp. TaxID=1968906 RepID=UPI001799CFE7|nr:Hpt domain-containing protein [Rhodoplanes sp.]NVO16663.1 Hpt domain-containing protein [Rhodoplanes sp.]